MINHEKILNPEKFITSEKKEPEKYYDNLIKKQLYHYQRTIGICWSLFLIVDWFSFEIGLVVDELPIPNAWWTAWAGILP